MPVVVDSYFKSIRYRARVFPRLRLSVTHDEGWVYTERIRTLSVNSIKSVINIEIFMYITNYTLRSST